MKTVIFTVRYVTIAQTIPWQDVRLFYNLKRSVSCQCHNFTPHLHKNITSEFFSKFVSSGNMGMSIQSCAYTRSSAVTKRPRYASCLYSFYTLKWCGYPMVKKIRTYVYSFWHDPRTWKSSPHFCFSWRRPCDYHAICCTDGKTIQCLPKPSQHVPIYLQ